jgi:hypothetical protein
MSSASPLLQLLLARPELFAEHAAAYAGLASEEARAWLQGRQRQWRWRLLGWLAITVGLLLAGQALMLWSLLHPQGEAMLTLILLPLLPLGVGLLALQAASREPGDPAFSALHRQLADDLALLRASQVPSGMPR